MAEFKITTQDGAEYKITAPDEKTAMEAFQRSQGGGQSAAPMSDYDKSYFAQGTSGINEGLGNMLGAPVDIMNAGIGLGMRGINAVAGTDLKPSDKPFLGSKQINGWMSDAGSIKPETDDAGKQFLRRTMRPVGSSIIPGGVAVASAAQPVATGLGVLSSALGSGTGSATAQQVFPGNPYAEIAGSLAGGFAGAKMFDMGQQALERSRAVAGAPSTEKLKETAGKFYDLAEKKGVTASQSQTRSLADDMRQLATDEGLISPTGRISEAYPKAREAINLLDDYAKGEMSVKQMQAVRKALSDASVSADGAERRIARMMLEKFDDFTAPLAPPLEVARQLYQRAMKADTLEQADELAASRAGQFSGSGYENARRTEYRGLERKIIKGQERGYSQAEQEAISKVAQGTPGANVARNIGRMAPTGPVSFATTAGVPFMVGNAVGGPAVGTAFAGSAAGAAYTARAIATLLGKRNADFASALIRSGGALPLESLDKATLLKVLSVLGTSTAANLPKAQTNTSMQPAR